jgi:hypothetical protein
LAYGRTKNYKKAKRYFPGFEGKAEDSTAERKEDQKSAGERSGTLKNQLIRGGKMRFKSYYLGLLAVLFIVAGCSTTQELKTSITSKVSSLTDSVDPALVNQIPAGKKDGFPKAEFDLNVANEKVKLAELKSDLAANQKKYANLEEDLAENFQKEAAADYDLIKIEAIIVSNLGKSEDNLKVKAKLQSKKLDLQAGRVKINSNLEATKRKSESLTVEIAKMDEAIKAMKFSGEKATAPAIDKVTAPKTNGGK